MHTLLKIGDAGGQCGGSGHQLANPGWHVLGPDAGMEAGAGLLEVGGSAAAEVETLVEANVLVAGDEELERGLDGADGLEELLELLGAAGAGHVARVDQDITGRELVRQYRRVAVHQRVGDAQDPGRDLARGR